ncbi:hypothetical protein [uncultured Microbacterium sp.]|uniref:hypothetical protein n=1 Tax=uncultured Microbacterium sp. TaxID=191216 RepID=UPI0025DD7665|nr:hypothetical protein [uncultured Microbacterium sp.]
MTGFQIQVRSIQWDIWVVPGDPFSEGPKVVRSESVEVLRESIRKAADVRTLSFAQHVRIVTDRGAPVERWTIRPGSAKRLWRRY